MRIPDHFDLPDALRCCDCAGLGEFSTCVDCGLPVCDTCACDGYGDRRCAECEQATDRAVDAEAARVANY